MYNDILNLIEETKESNNKESFVSKHKGKIAGGVAAGVLGATAYKIKKDRDDIPKKVLALGVGGLGGYTLTKYRHKLHDAAVKGAFEGGRIYRRAADAAKSISDAATGIKIVFKAGKFKS